MIEFNQLIITIFGCFLLTATLVPLSIKVGFFIGAVDNPGFLKIHSKPITRFGGMALFLSSAVVFYVFGPLSSIFNHLTVMLISISTLLVFLCGALDDVKRLKPLPKFMIQILAIMMAVIGLCIYAGPCNNINVFLIFMFILAYTNSFNLIDGVDGLASGLALFIALGLLAISLISNYAFTIWTSSIIIGFTLGFLIFNFNPAKVFLGDGGSTLLGFLLALSASKIWIDAKNPMVLFPLLIILFIPIFDTICAIIRRLRNKKSIFMGDRSHLYDLLLQKGFSVKQTVLIFYAIGFLISVLGVSLFIIIEF